MKKIFIITTLALLISLVAKAQEPMTFNLYALNPYLINPAATGFKTKFEIFFNRHNQWTGFGFEPNVNTLGLHASINKSMSLGLDIKDDNRSKFGHFVGHINYSYNVKFSEDFNMVFGVGAGLIDNELDKESLVVKDANDPIYLNNTYSENSFSAGLGMLLTYRKLELHLSAPQLFALGKKLTGQYNIYGLYNYILSNDWNMKPTFMVRSFSIDKFQFESSIVAEWKKIFHFQAGYRTDNSIITAIGMGYSNYRLAYSYQANVGQLSRISSGTHEIQLAYRIEKK